MEFLACKSGSKKDCICSYGIIRNQWHPKHPLPHLWSGEVSYGFMPLLSGEEGGGTFFKSLHMNTRFDATLCASSWDRATAVAARNYKKSV